MFKFCVVQILLSSQFIISTRRISIARDFINLIYDQTVNGNENFAGEFFSILL